MAVFMTGDTHGKFDRLEAGAFPELDALTREDCVIICGDFGGVWEGGSKENDMLDRLNQRPFTTLFVDGNHENYDMLARFPVTEWRGGKVQAVRPNILHLMRGQVFALDGKRFFTMGGASTHDAPDGILNPGSPTFLEDYQWMRSSGARVRVNHRSWWKQELPSPEELQTARESLDRVGWKVDYIVTHCAPDSIQKGLVPDRGSDCLTEFLEEVRVRCAFEYWFMGHYHRDGVIENRYVLLKNEVLRL